ncbi:hypothetical protein [Mixta calida]|uniref:hypothetical protein n=1 Tax=Mixta calida TaxID=665913 RepID=UPI0034D578B5
MLIMKNFRAETRELPELGITILDFTDEQGRDWYDSQKYFKKTTLKIMFDHDSNILASSYDVSTLAPENLSVAEIEPGKIPAGFPGDGRWLFINGEIVKNGTY